MRNPRAGLALAELLIAMSLFLAVVAVGVGGFIRALRTIRQNANFVNASGNMGILIEQMSREIRTGYDFCRNGQVCASEEELSFKNAKGEAVTYRLEDETVTRTCETTAANGCNGESGIATVLTPGTVAVSHASFILFGNAEGDEYQPRVTVTFSIRTKERGVENIVTTLQSTISSRFPLDT